MSLIGGYRASGPTSVSGSVFSSTIINFTGFKPSSMTNGNALAVCMFKWDPSANMWVPYTG